MMFAAGFGTRMGALTRDIPKPMVAVKNAPLINHALAQIRAAGSYKIVVNTHYKADVLHRHLVNENVHISHEKPEILDTGGGLRQALPVLGHDPVFTMNTDAIFTGLNPLAQLSHAWDPTRMDALLLCVPQASAIGHAGQGDFVMDDTGALCRGPGVIYTGVQIIKTDRLSAVKDTAFSLNLLWDQMLQEGRVFGHIHQGSWCDVGHPAGIELAEKMMDSGNV